MSITLSSSLLSYEYCISDYMKKINEIVDAGVREIHVDIMRIPFIVHNAFEESAVKEVYGEISGRVSFDFHLMEDSPDKSIYMIKDMAKKDREKNTITIHREAYMGDPAGKKVEETLSKIRDLGFQAGLALEPGTSLQNVSDGMKEYLNRLLVMTVRPGRGNQKYMPEMTPKIREASETFDGIRIGADGGINEDILKTVLLSGTEIPVVGTSITEKHDVGKATEYFLREIKRFEGSRVRA